MPERQEAVTEQRELLVRVLSMMSSKKDIELVLQYVEKFHRVDTILDMLEVSHDSDGGFDQKALQQWLHEEFESAQTALDELTVWVHEKHPNGYGIVTRLMEPDHDI